MMEVKPSVCTMKKAQSILVNMFFQVKVHDTEAGQCVNADVRDLLQECIWAEGVCALNDSSRDTIRNTGCL